MGCDDIDVAGRVEREIKRKLWRKIKDLKTDEQSFFFVIFGVSL